jgi:putative membrane protein insertion efficiency factor
VSALATTKALAAAAEAEAEGDLMAPPRLPVKPGEATVATRSKPSNAESGRPGLVARLLISSIHLYQAVRAGRPSPCRFVPSCSAYGAEALARHGAGRGLWLTARRLGRCHPWGGHGADPVPELRNS